MASDGRRRRATIAGKRLIGTSVSARVYPVKTALAKAPPTTITDARIVTVTAVQEW
jgi:hypothetical protein